ncbi:hypothetical protein [Microbispora sp. H11081]|uniref:hypothetical protein n=1 Tax=Microbispora sp. H11081 TaxID=2729107 RepID=UPI0014748DF6|nr:hypothetical protein [Microbispora sp. H11081]
MTFDHDLGLYELGPEEREALRCLLYEVVPPPTEEEGAAMFHATTQAGEADHDASLDGDGAALDRFADQPGWWDPSPEFSHEDAITDDRHRPGDGYDIYDGHHDDYDYGAGG